jgi:hypothetical protein
MYENMDKVLSRLVDFCFQLFNSLSLACMPSKLKGFILLLLCLRLSIGHSVFLEKTLY